MAFILLVVGIFILIKGADWLVDGSGALAKRLGIPSIIIGLTVISFGTSMPEFVVSLVSAFQGETGTAFGNIIGSNLANILLILGVTGVVSSIKIKSSTIWKEIPFSLLAAIALFVVSNDIIIDNINIPSLTRTDGLVLLLFLAVFIYYIVEAARRNRSEVGESFEIVRMGSLQTTFLILLGILGLFVGGKLVVENAVLIAESFGVSNFLIGATIIAVGTSLPELVTSIRAIKKGDSDLVVGNIVGSNIFNIFWILGATSIVSPIEIPSNINLDIIFLVIATLLLFVFMFLGEKHKLERYQAGVLLALYAIYIAIIITRG